MERLVTTSQAAEILGLSLQGIHYRIKKNQLKSIKKDGKTFVYINDDIKFEDTIQKTKVETSKISHDNNQSIIDVKNEQTVAKNRRISSPLLCEFNKKSFVFTSSKVIPNAAVCLTKKFNLSIIKAYLRNYVHKSYKKHKGGFALWKAPKTKRKN